MLAALAHFHPAASHSHGFWDLVVDAVVRGTIYQIVHAAFRGQSLLAALGIGLGILCIAGALYSLRRR